MCGFFLSFGDFPAIRLKQIRSILTERGGDQYSELAFGQWNLTFSRLSTCGDEPSYSQPVWTIGENEFTILNGLIYNFELLKKKYSLPAYFNDTYVCHWLIKTKGLRAALNELNGMFAIVHGDTAKKEVYFATDQFGQKPIYYRGFDKKFIIASNVRCITELSRCSIDTNAMEIYLSSDETIGTRGYFLPGHTMFKEINSAVGGKIYKATGQGDFCKVSTHGEFKFEPKDPVKTPKEFRKKLIGNISNYLHNENTGLFYSGGVDSSLLMNAIFELSRSSECSLLTKVAQKIDVEAALAFQTIDKTSWKNAIKVEVQSEDFVNDALDFIRSSGFPLRWGTAPSLMPLYRQLKQLGAKVVLLGDGADEIWGGYGQRDRLRKLTKQDIKKMPLSNFLAKFTFSGVDPNKFHLIEPYFQKHGYADQFFSIRESANLVELYRFARQIDLDIFFKTIAAPNSDAVAGMFGIEARSPFLDANLQPALEPFMNEHPKNENASSITFNDKPMLRQALESFNRRGKTNHQFKKVGTRNFFTNQNNQKSSESYVDLCLVTLKDRGITTYDSAASISSPKTFAKHASLGMFLSQFTN